MDIMKMRVVESTVYAGLEYVVVATEQQQYGATIRKVGSCVVQVTIFQSNDGEEPIPLFADLIYPHRDVALVAIGLRIALHEQNAALTTTPEVNALTEGKV